MPRANRISPTEIESREDALEVGDSLADYSTLDTGLKSISSSLRLTIVVGLLTIVAFAVLGVAYVRHEDKQERQDKVERNELLVGVCDTVAYVTRAQVNALIAAASADGTPPDPERLAAYVDPIEEAISKCAEQIPPIE